MTPRDLRPVPPPLPADDVTEELEDEPLLESAAVDRSELAAERRALAAERVRLGLERAALEKKIAAFRATAGAREAALARKESEVKEAARLFSVERTTKDVAPGPMRRLVARRRVRRI